MTTTAPVEPVEFGGDLRIVDCDAHFSEPPDLWISRVPASMKDRVPVMRTIDEVSAWYLDDAPFCHIGGNVLGRKGEDVEKFFGVRSVQPWAAIHPSCWDAAARVALLDDLGLYAQILYPNAIAFSSNTVFSVEDVQQRSVIQETYNDWLIDVQNESGNRLFPQAPLPVWDMNLTVAEMTRLHEQGIRGFTISDKPHTVGLPDLDAPYFEPMWALANEMEAVFNFHIGNGAAPAKEKVIRNWGPIGGRRGVELVPDPERYFESFGPQRRVGVGTPQGFMSNVRVVLNFCMGNFFDRYPNVKIVSVESGLGWIPFVLEFAEFTLDEIATDPDEVALCQRRPTEYFRDHMYVTYWFEKVGPAKLIEDIGVNNVLVETDIPHPVCLYPDPVQRLLSGLAGSDVHTRRRVLQDNAVELYGIPIPASV